MSIWIGTSGWSYPHWRGTYYPAGLPARRELGYVSEQLGSLEINRSFYALLRPATCAAWAAETPRGFVFALKGSRHITHIKKLRDVEVAIANFFAAGPLALGDKLGPLVWQLPATLAYDEARLSEFFRLLPRTNVAAAELARARAERGEPAAIQLSGKPRRLRHAIEPRHPSFQQAGFAALARAHRIAIVVADSADWPCIEETTTDFMYVRLHGGERTYQSAYGAASLARWARRIEAWTRGTHAPKAPRISDLAPKRARDVYVYFDNDAHAHAPRDALALARRMRTLKPPSPR